MQHREKPLITWRHDISILTYNFCITQSMAANTQAQCNKSFRTSINKDPIGSGCCCCPTWPHGGGCVHSGLIVLRKKRAESKYPPSGLEDCALADFSWTCRDVKPRQGYETAGLYKMLVDRPKHSNYRAHFSFMCHSWRSQIKQLMIK